MHVETDVLVIGSGGAGMYAAIEAARAGARVFLADRSLIGRGGATVMAQMTVAVALGSETPDHWSHHYDDTLEAGRGLCDERLARLLCEEGPDCIREMDEWGIGWARKDGRIAQALAPGHDRPRCVYVDFLNTGPAVSKTLRTVVTRTPRHPQGRRPADRRSRARRTARSPARSRCICRPARRSRSPPRRRSSRPAGSPGSTAATAPPPTWAATAMRWRCAPARRSSTWSSCSSSRSGIWRRG